MSDPRLLDHFEPEERAASHGEGTRLAVDQEPTTRVSEGEMLAFLLGATIDREEWPRSAEDLVWQTWRWHGAGYVLVENSDETQRGSAEGSEA